jgi:hypothetical protein
MHEIRKKWWKEDLEIIDVEKIGGRNFGFKINLLISRNRHIGILVLDGKKVEIRALVTGNIIVT